MVDSLDTLTHRQKQQLVHQPQNSLHNEDAAVFSDEHSNSLHRVSNQSKDSDAVFGTLAEMRVQRHSKLYDKSLSSSSTCLLNED